MLLSVDIYNFVLVDCQRILKTTSNSDDHDKKCRKEGLVSGNSSAALLRQSSFESFQSATFLSIVSIARECRHSSQARLNRLYELDKIIRCSFAGALKRALGACMFERSDPFFFSSILHSKPFLPPLTHSTSKRRKRILRKTGDMACFLLGTIVSFRLSVDQVFLVCP